MTRLIPLLCSLSIVGLSMQGCDSPDSNPVAFTDAWWSKSPPTRSEIHGTWKCEQPSYGIAYFTYDSSDGLISEKHDYGHNFRNEDSGYTGWISSSPDWGSSIGGAIPWWCFRFNKARDTLFASRDSLFTSRLPFTRVSHTVTLQDWVGSIPAYSMRSYPQISLAGVAALSYSAGYWYLLTRWGSGILHRISLDGLSRDSISFPNVRAMDVSGDELWLAGNFFIERRRLQDTVLLARYDISQYFTSNFGNHWIQGMAVLDTTVYLMTSFERMFLFNTGGTLLRQGESFLGLYDMHQYLGGLWGTSDLPTIFQINPQTFEAMHTYTARRDRYEHNWFMGITSTQTGFAVAELSRGYLRIFEFPIP